MLTHNQLINKIKQRPEVLAEIERLESEEMPILDNILSIRKEVGLTQAEVAERMGSSVPAVSRLENALQTGSKPSPSLDTLQRYANALGKRLTISFG